MTTLTTENVPLLSPAGFELELQDEYNEVRISGYSQISRIRCGNMELARPGCGDPELGKSKWPDKISSFTDWMY